MRAVVALGGNRSGSESARNGNIIVQLPQTSLQSCREDNIEKYANDLKLFSHEAAAAAR